MFPAKLILNERKNLRPFGQLVSYFNYTVMDKLSPRSYWTRIVGYTLTYRIYYMIGENRKITVAKNPQTIAEKHTSSSDEARNTNTPDSSEDEANNEKKNQQKGKTP